MNIYQKLIEVRKSVPYLQKENSGQQYKYVSSSQVLATVRQKMDEVGLLLIPEVTGHNLLESTIEQKDKETKDIFKRTTTYFTEIDMSFTWVNAENPDETIKTNWYAQGVDIAGEKGVGKALTYGEKYFLLKFFNIATDKDDPDSFQDKHDDKKPDKQDKPKQIQTVQSELSDKQVQRLWAIAKEAGQNDTAIHTWIKQKYNKDSVKAMTKKEYDTVCEALEKAKSKEAV